jgi:hypothetical protein
MQRNIHDKQEKPMSAYPRRFFALIFALVFTLGVGVLAGERADLLFTNGLNQEILLCRVKYSTPHDEPRYMSSSILLPPGQEWRVGVQGVILPERILLDTAAATYDFDDLSGLNPDREMRLEVLREDGLPRLRRLDSEDAEVVGTEIEYLTPENRLTAVDRGFLTSARNLEDVRALVEVAVKDATRDEFGEEPSFDLEAGPIMNQEQAESRCPEVVEEWNRANDGAARWNGNWSVTIPDEMSVCGCAPGTEDLSGTLFEQDDGWGKALSFPLLWMEWFGVARVRAVDEDDSEKGLVIDLRFSLPDEGREEMLDELMRDLRIEGLRPWSFQMAALDSEGEKLAEVELAFHDGDKDKYDTQNEMQEALFAAYNDADTLQAIAIWVKEEEYEKARNGEELSAAQAVRILFGKGTFNAVFVPDGRMLME